MARRDSPCLKCPRRTAICHAQCKEYHDWAAEVREQHRAQQKGAGADAVARDTITKIRRRNR